MFQCKSKMSYFAEQLTVHTASSLVMPIHNPASLSLVWPFASKSSSWCLNIVYLFFKSFSQNSFYQSSSCFSNFYLFTLQKLRSLPFNPTGKATRPVVATLQEGLILVLYAKNRCAVMKANAKKQGVNNRWNQWSENQSINRWQSMPINRLISIIDEQSMLEFYVIFSRLIHRGEHGHTIL